MRFESFDGDSVSRPVGAVVVRTDGLGITLDFGPADGPAMTRLQLSKPEALRLISALKSATTSNGEEVILVDD